MHCRVTRCFALGAKVYHPGLYELTEDLAEDAGQLVREGLLIVFFDESDSHTLKLETPEDGQRLECRTT